MAGVLGNFTLAAAGANDEAAAFTTDEDKALAPSNTPARDIMSVSAIGACAITGRERETGCGERTFTSTQLPIQTFGLWKMYNGEIFRPRMNKTAAP